MGTRIAKIILAGLAGGFIGNSLMGLLFKLPPISTLLYHPEFQSQLFRDITPDRNLVVSVAGLVLLSILHAWLYRVFLPSIPGDSWPVKGLFWGFTIWLMYWLFQEWFIYITLLGEPIYLALLELVILLAGSLVEGLIIAVILRDEGRWAKLKAKASIGD